MGNEKITSFMGKNRYLSNFYPAPIEYEGIRYQNNEAAFQAQKAEDMEIRLKFKDLPPDKAKRLGRSVKLRPDWEACKAIVMYEIVKAKFTQNEELGKMLVSTGDAHLEEGNTWGDTTWGTVNGVGSNMLGKILMEVRAELAAEQGLKPKNVLCVIDSGDGKWYYGYTMGYEGYGRYEGPPYSKVFNVDAWNLFHYLKKYYDNGYRIKLFGSMEEFLENGPKSNMT